MRDDWLSCSLFVSLMKKKRVHSRSSFICQRLRQRSGSFPCLFSSNYANNYYHALSTRSLLNPSLALYDKRRQNFFITFLYSLPITMDYWLVAGHIFFFNATSRWYYCMPLLNKEYYYYPAISSWHKFLEKQTWILLCSPDSCVGWVQALPQAALEFGFRHTLIQAVIVHFGLLVSGSVGWQALA